MQPDECLPGNLIFILPSILERIELTALFPKALPLEVELGCGDASFLVKYAQLHPERNFIGVERLLGRIRKLDRKGRRGDEQERLPKQRPAGRCEIAPRP